MPLCPDCNHDVSKHGPDGCTYERGDAYQSGFAPMALGPCGCRVGNRTAAMAVIQMREQAYDRIDKEWDRILDAWLGRKAKS